MRLIDFIRQKSYEHIEHKVRRSLATLVPTVAGFLVLSAVPVAIYWLVNALFPAFWTGPVVYPLGVLWGSVYCLLIAVFFYSYFIDFYLDLFIVTNDRIIDVEQRGLFARTVTEADLYHVQDVTSEVPGLWGSIFKYGTLTVQTAAVGKLELRDVPHPHRLRQAILDLAAADRRHHTK